VKAAVRDKEKAKKIDVDNVQLVHFDFDERDTWEKALTNTDKLFLQVPNALEKPHEKIEPFIKDVKNSHISHIVLMTAMGIDMARAAPMKQVETLVENSGLPYTFLRPNWFMQNFFTSLKSKIVESGELILPAGDAKVSFVDARDISACAMKSYEDPKHRNMAYTITGGEAHTHYDVAEKIGEAIGKEVKYIPVMQIEYRDILRHAGFSDESSDNICKMFDTMSKGFNEYVSPDVPMMLDREPVSLGQFTKDYADKWKT
jgi:uncharacterized protein YbjT (DUF2867 family)